MHTPNLTQPVLVTGASGYIGSWLVKYLLQAGFTVRAMVRNKNNQAKTEPLVKLGKQEKGKLEIWEGDLLVENAYEAAMTGCQVVYHIASPFLQGKIKDPYKQLIDPAVKGTTNVLNTANRCPSVERIVLTSSIMAVYGDNNEILTKNKGYFDEEDYNSTCSAQHQPYPYSKLLAEQKAWEIAQQQNQWTLVCINPGFVMGPALTQASQSFSIDFIQQILRGDLRTGAPDYHLSLVDVRDVARAHVVAGTTEVAQGRYIVTHAEKTILEYCQLIGQEFPNEYKLPKANLPKVMLYLFGWTQGFSWKFVKNNIGFRIKLDNRKSIKELGMNYRPLSQTIRDHVLQLKTQ